MPQNLNLNVGPVHVGDGNQGGAGLRASRELELVVSENHGRFYEKNSRNGLFGVAWNAVTIAATHNTPLTAGTGTPITSIYNPIGSGMNIAILKVVQDLTSGTPAGPLVWNNVPLPQNITAASASPISMNINSPVSSVAKTWTNTAVTGSTAGVLLFADGGFAAVAAGAGIQTLMNMRDGDIIIPPGTMLALCSYGTGTSHLTSGLVIWEEVSVQ
jgi:hypothetical protein